MEEQMRGIAATGGRHTGQSCRRRNVQNVMMKTVAVAAKRGVVHYGVNRGEPNEGVLRHVKPNQTLSSFIGCAVHRARRRKPSLCAVQAGRQRRCRSSFVRLLRLGRQRRATPCGTLRRYKRRQRSRCVQRTKRERSTPRALEMTNGNRRGTREGGGKR